MVTLPRVTLTVLAILDHFVGRGPDEWTYGMTIMEATGLWSGTVYPILARLEAAGWTEREREDIDPRVAGRPVRVMYRLTPAGRLAARALLVAREWRGSPLTSR